LYYDLEGKGNIKNRVKSSHFQWGGIAVLARSHFCKKTKLKKLGHGNRREG